MIEMKVLAAFILHNFEVTTTDRLEDIRFQYNLTILPDKELNFKLHKRTHDKWNIHFRFSGWKQLFFFYYFFCYKISNE